MADFLSSRAFGTSTLSDAHVTGRFLNSSPSTYVHGEMRVLIPLLYSLVVLVNSIHAKPTRIMNPQAIVPVRSLLPFCLAQVVISPWRCNGAR